MKTIDLLVIIVALSVSTETLAANKKKKAHVNLPKITDTDTHTVSIHEDLNFYGEYPSALSSTTVDYGLTEHWDIGVSVNNIPIDNSIDDYDISVLLTLERNFQLSSNYSILAGTSIGSDIVSNDIDSGIDLYSYISGTANIGSITMNAGGYYANYWFGGYNTVGFTAGITIPINQQWNFQYEFISGSNNLSGPTYQLFYQLNKTMALGFGVQNQYNDREQLISGIVSLYYQ